jgi:hypothetical protein
MKNSTVNLYLLLLVIIQTTRIGNLKLIRTFLVIPSTIGRVIWKKTVCMCVCLCQGKKKHQRSIRCFRYPSLKQLGSKGLGIQLIRFRGARKFSQWGFEKLEIQPIKFRGARKFSQSGFAGLGIQPIRLRHSQKFRLTNSGTRIRGAH